MLKFLVTAALLGFCACAPAGLRFPATNPCVLVDIDASIHMSWTDREGRVQNIPDFTFGSAGVMDGSCENNTPLPSLTLSFTNGIIFTIRFVNDTMTNTVKNTWTMRYSPQTLYKNNVTGTVQHTGNIGNGDFDKAFACQHIPVVNDTQTAVGMNKFGLTITIKSYKSQGFGVKDGKYSQEQRCEADGVVSSPNPAMETTEPTTKPTTVTTAPTTTKPNAPTTEPDTSPNTEPSTKPAEPTTNPAPETTQTTNGTEPTTKPTNMTTEPTTKSTNGTTEPTTKPSTETTKPPSTTAPVLAPNSHPKYTFGVYTTGGQQCILMVGEFLFTLAYTKKDDTNATVDVGLQEIDNVDGDCNMTDGMAYLLSVTFYKTWQMDLTISQSASSMMLGADGNTKFHWSNLVLKYDLKTMLGGKPLFPNVKVGNETSVVELNATFGATTYEASSDGSYLCNANQDLSLGGDNKLQVTDLQYSANLAANRTSFPEKDLTECPADSKTSSVVPIAVGAALAGLVVIVLIAYLIGRRRNRKGYESV